MSQCPFLLFFQSENSVSKFLWTNVCTFKLYPNGSHNPPGANVMSYRGSNNNSEWHLVILLAELGEFLCLTSTGNSFHIHDISASLLILQPPSSCSFSASELKTRKPGGRSGIWIMESSAGWHRSELSWSLVLCWVSRSLCWDFTGVSLLLAFFPPTPSLCQLLKSTAELLVAL